MKIASSILPTKYGTFKLHIFQSKDKREHVALVVEKNLGNKKPILVRIHSQCLTGDTFFSLKCDCREQLEKSMKLIASKGGAIVYLNQEGRGIGLGNKVKAYALQDKGLDTVEANKALSLPADARDYKIAADILRSLGITQISLLTNNPQKIYQLEKYGIKIVKRIPLLIKPQPSNKSYLLAKKKKLGHIL